MTIIITLSSAGSDSGPFDLYSNVDGFITPFETGVAKSSLLSGYTTSLVPNYTTTVRVMSSGVCTSYVDISPEVTTTSTTTTAALAPCSAGMDVIFLLDYTGSMSTPINGIKASINDIANTIAIESNNDYRLGLVIYDEDYTSGAGPDYSTLSGYTSLPSNQRFVNVGLNNITQWITAMEKMSNNNISTFTNQLNLLNTPSFPLGYGVGAPEPADMGIDLIATSDNVGYEYFAGTFRNDVSKLIILVTDQFISGNDDTYNQTDIDYMNNLIPVLVNQGIRVLLMTTAQEEYPSYAPFSHNILYDLATGTNGLVSNSFLGAAIQAAIENICIDTTTTTTTITTTITTTAAPPSYYTYYISSPGRSSSGLACAETTFPNTVYSYTNTLYMGAVLYSSISGGILVNPVEGGDLWYKEGIDGVALQINSSGVIINYIVC